MGQVVGLHIQASERNNDEYGVGYMITMNDKPIIMEGWSEKDKKFNEIIRKVVQDGLDQISEFQGTSYWIHTPIPDQLTVLNNEKVDEIDGKVRKAKLISPFEELVTGIASHSYRFNTTGKFENEVINEKPKQPVFILCDGSEKTNINSTTVGYVVVDIDGNIYAVGAKNISEHYDYLHAEYQAVKKGLEYILNYTYDIGYVRVVTDNKQVAESLTSNTNVPERVQPVREEVSELLYQTQTNVGNIEIKHVTREHNQLADGLATFGHSTNFERKKIRK